jgi:GH24 family phage-related lysozyme (muramidase)
MPQTTAPKGKAALVATVGASAAYTLFCCVSGGEGLALTPYQDRLARNIMTVCYGDTQAEMRNYTKPECDDLLYNRLATFTRQVKRSTPNFDSLTPGQKVAVVDTAYNIGMGNYDGSTLRRLYVANQFPAACYQFMRWRFVNGKDCKLVSSGCPGTMKRREKAEKLCLGE